MERRNPILNFRCTPDQPKVSGPQIYSVKAGLHQFVTDNVKQNIGDDFYTNSLITRSREATDATEYSE